MCCRHCIASSVALLAVVVPRAMCGTVHAGSRWCRSSHCLQTRLFERHGWRHLGLVLSLMKVLSCKDKTWGFSPSIHRCGLGGVEFWQTLPQGPQQGSVRAQSAAHRSTSDTNHGLTTIARSRHGSPAAQVTECLALNPCPPMPICGCRRL